MSEIVELIEELEEIRSLANDTTGVTIDREEEVTQFIGPFYERDFKKHFRVSKDTFVHITTQITPNRVPRGPFKSPKFDILCLLLYLSSGSFMF